MEHRAFMINMIQSELEDAVGVENVSVRPTDQLVYGVDYFWVARMWADKAQEPPKPDFIVRPGSAEEVSKVLKIANYYKIPVQTWGGGSGSQGSALAMAGGIILDIKRMNKLIDINEEPDHHRPRPAWSSSTWSGTPTRKGYCIMHIPCCLTCGTIGGALGHRGIGIMSTKYGKIDDMCISMEVVLPNGDIINTLPVPKHAAGPDLNQIFIGSEGTLGVITKATFKLFEQPENRQFRAFLFPDMHGRPQCLPGDRAGDETFHHAAVRPGRDRFHHQGRPRCGARRGLHEPGRGGNRNHRQHGDGEDLRDL